MVKIVNQSEQELEERVKYLLVGSLKELFESLTSTEKGMRERIPEFKDELTKKRNGYTHFSLHLYLQGLLRHNSNELHVFTHMYHSNLGVIGYSLYFYQKDIRDFNETKESIEEAVGGIELCSIPIILKKIKEISSREIPYEIYLGQFINYLENAETKIELVFKK